MFYKFSEDDLTRVRENLEERLREKTTTRAILIDEMQHLQTVIYVMTGGGMLGRFAAEQPADFYIDLRVGRLPYPKKEIYQAIKVLEIYGEVLGYNTHDMPRRASWHSCGVF